MNCGRIFFSLIVVVCSSFVANAQNFGGNPATIKWQQVNTGTAKIIFPKGLDSAAYRIAAITTALSRSNSGNLGNQQRKIPIVLQGYNTVSNAYVQLAPWRSEFYMMPPQDPFELGSIKWVDNLAIHEYRHAEQYSNFNVGLSKFFSILLGQQGQAFANAVAVPDWFFEGDAVWNETAFSHQGRGRLPSNFNPYKSLYFGDKHYSYMKLRNGSLKNYVPNHYDLGYLLVAYGREKYGDSIWRQVSHDAAAFKGLFYPWQNAVKRHIGITYTSFVKDAMTWYQQQWQSEKTPEPNWISSIEKNNVINCRYPYPTADAGMVYLKYSNTDVRRFIKRSADGREAVIAIKDIGNDDYFSYNNGRIIYTATRADIRWGNRDYSDIRVLDINTGNAKSITTKEKYFSPDINGAGTKIVAVKADPFKRCLLELMDENGMILQQWTADSSFFYSHPKFLNDDKNIVVACRQSNGHMGWLQWNYTSNEYKWLLQPANRIIGFPVVVADSLFYTATAANTDALFVIDLQQPAIPVMIARYQTGIYQGYAKDGKLVASAFTADGYRLANFVPEPVSMTSLLSDQYNSNTIAGKENVLAENAGGYTVKKYSKLTNPFNFNSWQAEISDNDYTVSLLGENVLSSVLSEFYYTYNSNERSNKLGFTGTYGGLFVQPFVGASHTWGREVALNRDTTLFYNQFNGNIGLQLPLNFSFGKQYQYLTLSASLNKENDRWTDYAKGRFRDLDFNYYRLRLIYSSQIQKAPRHIYPHFAQSWIFDYRSIFNTYTAHQFEGSVNFYLPGFYKTHSIVLTAAYHARDTMQQYLFSSSFPFSRGYRAINYPRTYKLGVNYHFPIIYPDWGFGQIVYFRRIRGNVFYDLTRGKSLRTGLTRDFSAVGGEIYFDTNWWNQQPATFGIRYSRLLDKEFSGVTNPNFWEIVLPVNLLPR